MEQAKGSVSEAARLAGPRPHELPPPAPAPRYRPDDVQGADRVDVRARRVGTIGRQERQERQTRRRTGRVPQNLPRSTRRGGVRGERERSARTRRSCGRDDLVRVLEASGRGPVALRQRAEARSGARNESLAFLRSWRLKPLEHALALRVLRPSAPSAVIGAHALLAGGYERRRRRSASRPTSTSQLLEPLLLRQPQPLLSPVAST